MTTGTASSQDPKYVALLNPNTMRRATAEQALSYAWSTSFATPTEHDLCNPRENFDARSR